MALLCFEKDAIHTSLLPLPPDWSKFSCLTFKQTKVQLVDLSAYVQWTHVFYAELDNFLKNMHRYLWSWVLKAEAQVFSDWCEHSCYCLFIDTWRNNASKKHFTMFLVHSPIFFLFLSWQIPRTHFIFSC